MALPALDSGRSLEVLGDEHPRGMITLDRTRLIGRLPQAAVLARGLPCAIWAGICFILIRIIFPPNFPNFTDFLIYTEVTRCQASKTLVLIDFGVDS